MKWYYGVYQDRANGRAYLAESGIWDLPLSHWDGGNLVSRHEDLETARAEMHRRNAEWDRRRSHNEDEVEE